jgi:hypothetical protein
MRHHDPALSLSPPAHSPIFIGGQHRSGTTLMRRLLARHPHIACGPESNLFRDNELLRIRDYLRTEWAPGLDPRYKFDPATVDRVLAALVNAVFMPYSSARHKRRWAEKTPKNILYIETLFTLFPTAQFIHMIRDPRDVYCSVREKAARTTPRWASITPAESARGWCRRIGCGLSWRERPDRYREVRYEELVTQPEAVMRSLLTFLGEPWSPSVLEGEQIFSTSVGRWRVDLTAAEIGEIEAAAGEIMSELGYPLSTTVTLTA